jgi:hypothetical protein
MMGMHKDPMEAAQVACAVCLKEVPQSEAVVPEAEDYVAYFCGLECYQMWRSQHEPPVEPGAASTAGGESQESGASGRAKPR